MVGDSSKPRSAPDPHHPSELSMPEENARRWVVIAFLAFWGLTMLVGVLIVVL